MATRYGALTLQLKNLSDLSNIGSTFTNIFSASGKQVLSGVGSGSFTYSARDNSLHTAVKAADGQVAYIYQTDAVASGAAMDVCCIIIDGRNITTSPDGATVTVSGQDILDQLTYTNAGTGAIDDGAGGPSSTDLDDIMGFAASGWSYTATGTGSSTRSSTGSYHATKGDNVLQLLAATAKRSGDIFRLSSYSPPAKTVAWRASADSSGVTLRMPSDPTVYDGSTTTGIILSMTEETDVSERITGVRPYGAGIGDGRLDITGITSGNTGGDPSGYSTTFASNLIVNTTLETALGYTKRLDVDFSDIGVEDGTNSTQLTSAAVDLWREAINFLQERDGAKTFYRVRCIVPYDLRPGQTVAISYTEYEGGVTGGSAVWTVSSSFTIHEVTNSVGQDGLRYTDLQVANTIKKQATADRVMAAAVQKAQATTRKSDVGTSPGSVSTGRTINATQPVRIDGGASADLSADRTLSLNGLSSVGSANQIPGANAGATAWEYKTVTAGTGISVSHSAGVITITNSSPGSALAGLAYVTIGNTGSLSAERALTAGDGLDLTDGGANSSVTFDVDVTDFIDTSFGLTESSNNIRVNLAATSGLSFSTGALQLDDSVAGAGLAIASKVLAVGGGDGIDVAANAIAVDVTDIVGSGLVEEATNNLALGTPSSLTASTTNAVTSTSHTHAIDSTIARSAITVTGTGALGGGGDLTTNRTITMNTPGTLTVSSSNSSAANHTHAITSSSDPGAAASLLATDSNGAIFTRGVTAHAGTNTDSNASGSLLIAIGGNTSTSQQSASAAYNAFVYSSTADHIPTFRGRKSLGTRSSPTAVGSGTVLARFGGAGWNGTTFPTESSAYMEMRATETHGGSAAGSHIRFGTTPDGSTTSAEVARLEGAGRLLIAETSNAYQTIGVTVNMATNTNEIATYKQSNVAHGMTSITDTNTFGAISIRSGTQGGMVVAGYHEGTTGVEINGAGVTDLTGKAAASEAYIHLNALKKSGSGVTTPGTGANLVAIRKNGSSVAIFAEDGDLYLDTAVNTDSWDAHNDMELLNGLRAAMVPDGHELRRRFGQFVAGARAVLESTGVVTFNEDGRLFVASKKLQMLTIDALRQKHERDTELISHLVRRIERLETAVNG